MKNLATSLDKLKQEQLLRTRNINSGAQVIEPIINGKKVLSFCSNDYLGLANHPQVKQSFIQATEKYGVGSGASHLITGHHQIHHALEEELADFFGTERALLFSTGYMANLGVLSALADRDSTIFEDRLNHASLIDAAFISRANLKRYQHMSSVDLEKKLNNQDSNTPKHTKFILSDGVFSMDGTVTPVEKLQSLSNKYQANLIIDDAHGIGVLGKGGRGCTENLLTNETILIGTLGKAFGTFGAFIAARADIIEYCIQRARTYVYTTAMPPAVAEASRTSLHLIRDESWRREKLAALVNYFRNVALEEGIPLTTSTTAIQPIVLGSTAKVLQISEYLLQKGLLVSAIRPPTVPNNTARLRVTLSTDHKENHINQLVEMLQQAIIRYK